MLCEAKCRIVGENAEYVVKFDSPHGTEAENGAERGQVPTCSDYTLSEKNRNYFSYIRKFHLILRKAVPIVRQKSGRRPHKPARKTAN